jgi:hypothetical protein
MFDPATQLLVWLDVGYETLRQKKAYFAEKPRFFG